MTQAINTQRINLGSLDNPTDIQQLTKHLQVLYNAAINITLGSAAPTTIPGKIGHQFIDTTNKHVYVATGNSAVTDWKLVS